MSSILKPYAEYKRSGLPWVPEIPSHWELTRNKNVMRLKKEIVGENHINYTLLSLTKQGIIPRDIENAKGKFPKEFDSYQVVRPSDLVFCLFDIDETPRTVGLSSLEGMITGAYTVFEPQIIHEKYLLYYYLALDNSKMLKPLYTGLRKVINIDTFLRTYMPYPPREEQNLIVKYLDCNLDKINKLIKVKKKQVALLKEQKLAVVNSAVTKGLDANAKMKYSGIDWIGDIPEGWEIKPLRQLLSPVSIKNRPDLPLLSVVRDRGIIIRDIENKEENHNFIPDDLSGYKVVEKSQFVMNKMKAWQGSYGVSQYDGIVSPAYYVFDVNFDNMEYFHYAVRSKVYINFFARASDGIRSGQWDLSLQKMKEIPFIIPPENEQKQIIEYIPKIFKLIEKAIQDIEREIQLVEEYKITLISNIVTGKIDIRDINVVEITEGIWHDNLNEIYEYGGDE